MTANFSRKTFTSFKIEHKFGRQVSQNLGCKSRHLSKCCWLIKGRGYRKRRFLMDVLPILQSLSILQIQQILPIPPILPILPILANPANLSDPANHANPFKSCQSWQSCQPFQSMPILQILSILPILKIPPILVSLRRLAKSTNFPGTQFFELRKKFPLILQIYDNFAPIILEALAEHR